MISQVGLPPKGIDWVYLIAHLLCVVLGEGVTGNLIILLLALFSWAGMAQGNFYPALLMLLLGSYHSSFENVYTSNLLGVKLVYITLLFFLAFSAVHGKFRIGQLRWLALFSFLFLLHFVLGFFFRYSTEWFLNESFSFFVFFAIILIVISRPKYYIPKLLGLLSKYVLYFYPLLVLVAVITAREEVLLFDEFEKFYFLALIPLILKKIPYRAGLILLHIIVMVIKAKYTYFSSLNIILMSTVVALIFLLSRMSVLRKTLLVLILVISAMTFYNYSSEFTKFKINQVQLAAKEVFSGDIAAIPKSPRVRVIEFLLSFENLKQQGLLFVITGKGYGSYIDDQGYGYFEKYGVRLSEDDYSLEEIQQSRFKKAHGGIPYIPIKMGILGMFLFLFFGLLAFFLSSKKELLWLGLSAPLYIITTFSYGLKNFIFVAFLVGMVLSLNALKNYEAKNNSD